MSSSEPTDHERELMQAYPQNAPIGWITGDLQRHAHIGTPGHPGPVESLCGATITRTAKPAIGAEFETCTVCWSASVWIRNRRAPAQQQQQDATRPSVLMSGTGANRRTTTNTR